jgi:Tol biopolymer transport system component
MKRRLGLLLAVTACVMLLGGCVEWSSVLVSQNAAGTDSGNDTSFGPSFSPDGSRIVFRSAASDLVATDTNGASDIFLRDLATGTTTLVSTNAAGSDSGNSWSSDPVFSPDGSKIVFTSAASDLGPGDLNGMADIYVRDLTTGATTFVSKTPTGGSGNGASTAPVLSADGNLVAFYSAASDLGPVDSNAAIDVYVADLHTGLASLVSVGVTGTDSGNGPSGGGAYHDPRVAFSPDSTRVAFTSTATDLVSVDSNGANDVFVRDLVTGVTSLVSVDATGTDSGDGYSVFPVFSPDSTRIAFTSAATDLGPVNPSTTQDIYIRDLTSGVTSLVGTAAPCSTFDFGASEYPTFSPDGTAIAFSSRSSLAAPDSNDSCDSYLRDLTSSTTELLSINSDGTNGGNAWSYHPRFSPDGTMVAIFSYANNLVCADVDGGESDVFVRDVTVDVTTLVSASASGGCTAGGSSSDPNFSPDSKQIAFTSAASDLGATDTNSNLDIYVATATPPSD